MSKIFNRVHAAENRLANAIWQATVGIDLPEAQTIARATRERLQERNPEPFELLEAEADKYEAM